MAQVVELPEELRTLFGNTIMPPETRKVILDYWNKMSTYERQELLTNLQKERDPMKRVLIALMTASNKLKFADIKRIIGEQLKIALNVTDFTITFAKLIGETWMVNISFPEKIGDFSINETALFSIDNQTGEVKQFQKGRVWNF
jgi:hypothetical protein